MVIDFVHLVWQLAWDIILTFNNQYLGLRRKTTMSLLWIGLFSKRVINISLGFPRSLLLLNDFMLCPAFIRNAGLSFRSN